MGRAVLAASAAVVVPMLALVACTSGGPTPAGPSSRPAPAVTLSPETTGPPSTEGFTRPSGTRRHSGGFDAAAALSDVRLLAGRIGPRLATGPAYRRAAEVVRRRFAELGYDVRREVFEVPAGDSWGVPVGAGRSFNVVAEPAGFDPSRPYVLLGAHLDTVARAPGAEDNASGVAVLLELARLAASDEDTRLPVVMVAFGAEEPRGPGDHLHHFGSQHQVRHLSPQRREALTAMVSLDRVGVGSVVPVCKGPLSPPRVQQALLRTAARIDVPARPCENTASDHWSFEKAGFAVARLGSTSYAAYHSPDDLPPVVGRP
ncbi:MAG TPA: M28 family peptidase, partial [Nocardioidaceae bacterium]|nr:M28 family peptidase [Nocardioidaceae bacterium]